MANPVIKIGGVLSDHFLEASFFGVVYADPNSSFGPRRFSYTEVHCLLLSETNQLTFQVAQEIFSVPVTPGKASDQELIDAFVAGLKRTVA